MDIRELDRRALALTGEIAAQVRADQLALPTPCADWTLYGLLRHLVSQNQGFAASARGEGASLSVWRDGELGADPSTGYDASAKLVTEAFAAEGVLDAPFAMPEVSQSGAFPGRLAIGFHLVDYLVHAWDVAATIGVAWEPDDELTAAGLRIAQQVPQDGRGPGAAFGHLVAVPEDSAPSDRLLALLGRTPSWTERSC